MEAGPPLPPLPFLGVGGVPLPGPSSPVDIAGRESEKERRREGEKRAEERRLREGDGEGRGRGERRGWWFEEWLQMSAGGGGGWGVRGGRGGGVGSAGAMGGRVDCLPSLIPSTGWPSPLSASLPLSSARQGLVAALCGTPSGQWLPPCSPSPMRGPRHSAPLLCCAPPLPPTSAPSPNYTQLSLRCCRVVLVSPTPHCSGRYIHPTTHHLSTPLLRTSGAEQSSTTRRRADLKGSDVYSVAIGRLLRPAGGCG